MCTYQTDPNPAPCCFCYWLHLRLWFSSPCPSFSLTITQALIKYKRIYLFICPQLWGIIFPVQSGLDNLGNKKLLSENWSEVRSFFFHESPCTLAFYFGFPASWSVSHCVINHLSARARVPVCVCVRVPVQNVPLNKACFKSAYQWNFPLLRIPHY